MKMRKLLTATVLSASLLFAPISASATTFNDVPSSLTAYEAIDHLSNKGVMSGYGNGKFQPNTYVQRQHIAATINRAIPITYVRNARNFKDVPPKHRNYSDIMVLQRAGILNGMANGYFKPADYVTRGQMAIILTKAFDLKNGGKRHNFKDVSPAHGADKAISSLYYNNVVQPDKNGKFKPNERVTRAEYADMLYHAWQASNYPMTPRHEAKKVVEKAVFSRADINRQIHSINQAVKRKKAAYKAQDPVGEGIIYGYQWDQLIAFEMGKIKNMRDQMAKQIAGAMAPSEAKAFNRQFRNYKEDQERRYRKVHRESGGLPYPIRNMELTLILEDRQLIKKWNDKYGY